MQAALKNIESLAHRRSGFTIVELLVVIVVIGILASITIVAFNGVQQSAGAAVLKSDLRNAQSQLEIANISNGSYPSDTSQVRASSGTVFEYTNSGSSYCITASSAIAATSFYIDSLAGVINVGTCPSHLGIAIFDPPPPIVTTLSHSCAVSVGRPFCWGLGQYGRLGNGSTAESSVPLAVTTSGVLAGRTVTSVTSGSFHSCALADGQPYCWGGGVFGQLGYGIDNSNYSEPVPVETSGVLFGRTVTSISTGENHTCAVADSLAFCWGYSLAGQIGNGDNTAFGDMEISPVAVDTSGVLAGRSVSSVATGDSHSCAVADGQAFCWGQNLDGQLGNGTTNDSFVPVAVSTSGVLSGRTVTAIVAGRFHTCALADGLVFCWGNSGASNSASPAAVNASGVLLGRTATAISAGDRFSCAIADAEAFCWGDGWGGELGGGVNTSSASPVAVSTSGVLAGRTVTLISSGFTHTCALADSQAFCWGRGQNGRLGNGGTINSSSPVAVSPLPGL